MSRKNAIIYGFLALSGAAALLAGWWAVRPPEPVRLGLAANLSGHGGTAGEYIREGAMLAAEEINARGGIRGRPLELLIKDDQNTEAGVLAADRELVEKGALVVFGHLTSELTLAAYPYVTSQNVMLFTAYTATNRLTGIDDLFFRTAVDTRLYGEGMGRLLQDKRVERAVFLLDMSNASFGQDYLADTRRFYTGHIVPVEIDSRRDIDWAQTLGAVQAAQAQAVVLLTEVRMTGLVAQKLREQGYAGELIATLWAQTPDLMRYGGAAVEGLSLLTFIDPENTRPAYLAFTEKLEERLKRPANARSVRAYEALMLIAEALEQCPTPTVAELKAALLAGSFETLMGTVRFDPFGDVRRPLYEVKVQDGRYVRARQLP